MDEFKYKHLNYWINDEGINMEVHYEYYSNEHFISDWRNFEWDELIDLIDHKTDLRDYQIKHILENPQKRFLIDFLIEDLNEKVHKIISLDFEEIIIKRKEEQDIKNELDRYDQEIFSSPDIE